MKTNTDPTFVPFLRDVCKGQEDAVAFLVLITDVAHFWDDLVDADPAPDREGVYAGMWACLVDLPRDPFYRRWFQELNPLVVNAVLDWRVANRLEAGQALYDRRISFIIRSSYVCILQQTALIVGGPEWAERCGVNIRVMAHAEGFDAYLKSLGGSDGIL